MGELYRMTQRALDTIVLTYVLNLVFAGVLMSCPEYSARARLEPVALLPRAARPPCPASRRHKS